MENEDITISKVEIDAENINITYDNGNIENLAIDIDTYRNMFAFWLDKMPPRDNDKYRNIMLSIVSLSQANADYEDEFNKLNKFFNNSNVEEVKIFLLYMRERKRLIETE